MSDDVYDFGKQLRELRELKGYTQAQVADRLGLSRSMLSEYESNLKYPKYDTLKGLALMYDSTPNYLLGVKSEFVINADGLTPEQISALMLTNNTLVDLFKKANLK